MEKCLKVFSEEDRAQIIVELLSVPRFEQLLQDPFANYVIQSALENSKVFITNTIDIKVYFMDRYKASNVNIFFLGISP